MMEGVKKSRAVPAALVAATAATLLTGCSEQRRCVDNQGYLRPDRECQNPTTGRIGGGGGGYYGGGPRFVYGGNYSGGRVTGYSSTPNGGFGSTRGGFGGRSFGGFG